MEFPVALNDGQHCCASKFKSLDISIPECNGQRILISSTLDCCPDAQYIPCPEMTCSDPPIGEDIPTYLLRVPSSFKYTQGVRKNDGSGAEHNMPPFHPYVSYTEKNGF